MQCPTRNHVAGIRLIFKCLDLKDTNLTANWKNEVRTEAESLPYYFFLTRRRDYTTPSKKTINSIRHFSPILSIHYKLFPSNLE